MDELRRALSEIAAIRGQLARAGEFRGYGPATLSATAALALVAALAQPWTVSDPVHFPRLYAAWWAGVALLAGGMIASQAVARSRRLHAGLSDDLLRAAFGRFLPAASVGLAATVVLVVWAPQQAPLLPALWQLIFCLGVFSLCRNLPRPVLLVGFWYLLTGLVCLARADQNLAPWMMGLPFAAGQLLAAVLLWRVEKEDAHGSAFPDAGPAGPV